MHEEEREDRNKTLIPVEEGGVVDMVDVGG